MISPDYSKRGYLLPKGCKDLIEVIKPPPLHLLSSTSFPKDCKDLINVMKLPGPKSAQAPKPPGQCPVTANLLVSEPISAGGLAALLGQSPFKIIADLMELGVFANLNQLLDFETICKVARKYGYTARRSM